MNYIVYDLEATCWPEKDRQNRPQEIIEIGALKFDEEGEEIERFSCFVKPAIYPTLSDFCKQLTNISQVDVNQADDFVEVIDDFKDWIGFYDEEEYLLCSWGFFDAKALIKNCQQHDLESNWVLSHISLKHQYRTIKGLPKPIGLAKALKAEGFVFDGDPHRGIDDAINTAKIFVKYLNLWRF